jgi:uncharacterized membrane protein YdbT with pleckstrin-like domain
MTSLLIKLAIFIPLLTVIIMILPDATLPAGLTNTLTALAPIYSSWNQLLPLDTMLVVFLLFLSIQILLAGFSIVSGILGFFSKL